jgi:hypothetical protein
MAAMVGAALITLILSFRMGDEARVLSRAVSSAAPGEWERQFEIGVGRLPVFLAQCGLNWIELDPHARAGLLAFRCGDVGIYRRCRAPESDPGRVMANVREAMDRRGWDSVVTVMDGHDTVAVFLPDKISSSRHVRACVMVMDDEQLVVVSARANLEPLMRLIHESEPLREFREEPEKWLPSWLRAREHSGDLSSGAVDEELPTEGYDSAEESAEPAPGL